MTPAIANATVRLGFNDRWDTNWPEVSRIKEVGGSEARVFVTVTRAVNEGAGYWDWLSQQVQGIQSQGVDPYFVLSDVPSYGGSNSYNTRRWEQTARELVARWPGIPVEVGNEPNNPAYGGQSAVNFARLFRSVRSDILGQDPNDTVISPAPSSTANRDGQAWATTFRNQTKNLSYSVAMHLYGVVSGNQMQYQFFRSLYPSRSPEDFWVTELGVSANGGLDRQADILAGSLKYLADQGTTQITIHSFFNYVCAQGWGIVDCQGQPRPAYYAVRDTMAQLNP